MKTTGFQRPAAAVFAAVALAATLATFAIGQARAQQTVNPVPPPPPPTPTFNPSTPNTVPQAPYVPVSPSAPSSPSVSAPAPAPSSPAVAPSPPVTPQAANPPAEQSPLHRAGTPAITAGFATAGAGATTASMPCACYAPPTIRAWVNSIRPIRTSAISTACGPAITRDCGAPTVVRGEFVGWVERSDTHQQPDRMHDGGIVNAPPILFAMNFSEMYTSMQEFPQGAAARLVHPLHRLDTLFGEYAGY